MANVLATNSIIAKTSLAILKNMLTFSANVNRDWEDTFTENMARGYAPGQTIQIKKPPRYTYRAGRVAVPQATNEGTLPLTLSQGGCDLSFTSAERTLSLTKLEDKIAAAIAPVANEIDRQGLQMAHFSTFNTINASGTLPNTQALAIQALTDMNCRLDEMAAPRIQGQRTFISAPRVNGSMVQGMAGLFQGSAVEKQANSGILVPSFGLKMGMDQNVDVHTNGTQAVTGTAVAGAGQTGATINVAALGGTVTKGTVITWPGVFAVNPQSRVSTGVLAQFVVTADLAAGATAIPVSPALVTSGAFQNVTASPTNAANFLIVGAASTTYQTNVAYHKDAFTLAMVPMWAPEGGKGVIGVHQETSDGFTVKVTEFYDGTNDVAITRIDVLFGWASPYPELSTKYYSL